MDFEIKNALRKACDEENLDDASFNAIKSLIDKKISNKLDDSLIESLLDNIYELIAQSKNFK